MKTYLKITLILVAGLALVILLHLALTTAAAKAPDPSPIAAPALQAGGNYGGNLRVALNEPSTLDPADSPSGDTTHWPIVKQIFEGLTKWDDDMEPLPAIAQSWESSDAQTWIFHIRPGTRFHNGRQVTAQDVIYSWDRVAAAGNEFYGYMVAPLVSTTTAVSTDTLQVTLNDPFAPFPALLALPFMSIVPSETVGTIATNPVGSGPFQFQSWTAGDNIALTYYNNYYAGRPYLDGITYQFYISETAMYNDYLLGNLDLSPIPDDRVNEVVGNPNAFFINLPGLHYYGMKVDQPPFDDVRVRQALNYAVDKQDIVDNIAPGYQVVGEGPVPPGMQGYDPPVPSYTYNPTLALDLLTQAGWTDTNSDGILDNGAGTDLTIELWYSTRHSSEASANAVADDFRDIGGAGLGAAVTVSTTDWITYFNNLDQYPMYRLAWFADYPDPYNFLDPHFRSGGASNHTNYSNAQVDAWLDQSLAAPDLVTRQGLYENIETQVQDDAPFINLYYRGAVYVKGANVLGLAIPAWWALEAVQMEKVQLFFHTHDVELQSILQPKSTSAIEPITPTVKVRNAGSSAETNIPVRCRILQNSTELYNQTQNIASLSPFATQVVVFPAWTPSTAGDYTFEFTTELIGDVDPTNDQETRVVAVSATAFYDAYTRDNPTDDGSIPTTEWWQSPNILVRHQDDNVRRHQDPILGQTNYVYVKVRNIGNATITDGYVNVYWHGPSPAIICGNWGLINPTPIPVGTLAPEESKWVKTAWAPPIEGHTCLFSRFWSGDDLVTFECDVPWDNNIAQRNVEVVELGVGGGMASLAQTGQASVLFEVTNVRDLPDSVDLIVERVTFPTTGTIALEFSNDFFSRWQAAGSTVEGGAVISGTTRISVTHPISTTIIGLPMGVRETQQVKMHLTGPPAAEFALYVTERIAGTTVGGMTYRSEIPWTIYLPVVLRDYSGGP